MIKLVIILNLLPFIFLWSCTKSPEGDPENSMDTLLTLSNSNISLQVNRYGGAFVDLQLNPASINPLTWKLEPDQMPVNNRNGAPFQGHFLCLGRWGSPTAGEIKAGIPHNGEPTNSWWEVSDQSLDYLIMQAKAPLDGLTMKREITLAKDAPVFLVVEHITNTLSIGRIFNVVQHPTIGPPFLQASTLINTNAGAGFLQHLSYPDPQMYAYKWPNGIEDSTRQPLDLRLSSTDLNYVSTHIFPDHTKYGWVTATNPEQNLLLGYIWLTDQYPWLNIWQQVEKGEPVAKGLEFGTTGIGRPYPELVATNTSFHDKNSYTFIDAGQQQTRSFLCFFTQVPDNYKGVKQVILKSDHLEVWEDDPNSRSILLPLSLNLK